MVIQLYRGERKLEDVSPMKDGGKCRAVGLVVVQSEQQRRNRGDDEVLFMGH